MTNSTSYSSAPVRVQIKPSPSLAYNNLSAAGNSLCYASNAQACICAQEAAQHKPAATIRQVESKGSGCIHTVCALPHGQTGFVLLGTEEGIEVWDKYAHHLLFSWALPASEQEQQEDEVEQSAPCKSQKAFVRGAAINKAEDGTTNICFGTSCGHVYVLQVDDVSRFTGPACFNHHNHAITSLSTAYQSRRGRWTDNLGSHLISADDSGAIAVWSGLSGTKYQVSHNLGSTTAPAVSLAVRNGFVIAARLDGTVELYNMGSKALTTSITAHSRLISAMDIHPVKDLIVTGAEDGSIAVFAIPVGTTTKVNVMLSVVWLHGMVTGVSFCGPTLDDVAAVAYDTDELQIFKATGAT